MACFGVIAGRTVSPTHRNRVDWMDESGISQAGLCVEDDLGSVLSLVSATLAAFHLPRWYSAKPPASVLVVGYVPPPCWGGVRVREVWSICGSWSVSINNVYGSGDNCSFDINNLFTTISNIQTDLLARFCKVCINDQWFVLPVFWMYSNPPFVIWHSISLKERMEL